MQLSSKSTIKLERKTTLILCMVFLCIILEYLLFNSSDFYANYSKNTIFLFAVLSVILPAITGLIFYFFRSGWNFSVLKGTINNKYLLRTLVCACFAIIIFVLIAPWLFSNSLSYYGSFFDIHLSNLQRSIYLLFLCFANGIVISITFLCVESIQENILKIEPNEEFSIVFTGILFSCIHLTAYKERPLLIVSCLPVALFSSYIFSKTKSVFLLTFFFLIYHFAFFLVYFFFYNNNGCPL